MASTSGRVLIHILGFVNEDRMSARAQQLVGEARDFTLADYGISSVEAVELMKTIEADFGVEIPLDEAANWSGLQDLMEFLDARS